MSQVWSAVLIHLFKGPLFLRDDPKHWHVLIEHVPEIKQYLAVLGLELYHDQSEGYAFLRQMPQSEQAEPLPRMIKRYQYSYWETVLAVILRRRLLELDSSGDQTRLVHSQDELIEMIKSFWPSEGDHARLREDAEKAILNFESKYKFLRRLPNQELEVERILRAIFDAQNLQELETYLDS
jgi:hypothetical protein